MKVEDVPEEYQHAVVAAYIALGTAPGGPDEIDIPSHNDVAFILAAVIPAIQNAALERAAVERLRGALERIADDITVIEDAANPDNWPANVARAALALAVAEGGGRNVSVTHLAPIAPGDAPMRSAGPRFAPRSRGG